MTPVELIDGYFFKRDDKYEIFGVKGGKARAAYQIISNGVSQGFKSFVTAGSRMSPQCEIVSYICENMGLTCNLFMPNGKDTSVLNNILKNKHSIIHRCKVGYNSVICSYAKRFSCENNSFYIPFGMECEDNIEITKHQVKNIPDSVKRIVIPCGSGMSMISVLKGLDFYGMFDKKVVGVQVGKNPIGNLNRFMCNSNNLFSNIEYEIVKSHIDYHQKSKQTSFCGIELDPIYEAKCIPFLKKGDLLWIVGKRM